jgi:hypothetical protein
MTSRLVLVADEECQRERPMISWDVELRPYAPRITDQPWFRETLQAVLHRDAASSLAPNPWASRERGPRCAGDVIVVLRVVADTEAEADAAANAILMRAFSHAVDEAVGLGTFGWTVACRPRPTWEIR